MQAWGVIVVLAVSAAILGLAVAVSLRYPDAASGALFFGLCFATLVALLAAWAAVARYRVIRDRTWLLTATTIERREANGRSSFWMDCDSMRTLCTWRFRSGAISSVAVRAEWGRVSRFSGFDDMDSFAESLRRAAPPGSEILERRRHVDWANPLIWVALVVGLLVVCSGGAVILYTALGARGMWAFISAWYLGFGLCYLGFRPYAEAALRPFARMDVVMGLTWVSLAALNLALALIL